jgi:nuclease S1
MKVRLQLFAALILMVHLGAPSAGAWARLAHRVASKIACDGLTPEAGKAVLEILGAESCADIGAWADDQREIPRTAPWHYVNIPIFAHAYDPKYCPRNGCVIGQIEVLKQALQDPHEGMKRKQIALKFLVHLIEDLHNPMHIGDNNDKGGNLLQLQFFGETTNLHRIWDVQIIEKRSKSEDRWIHDVRQVMNPKNIAEWSRNKTAVDWANETLEIARLAYRNPLSGKLLAPGMSLNQAYYGFAYPRIREQLAKSACRVTCTLNEIFQ